MSTVGAFEDITTELKNAYPPGTFEEPVNKETKYRRDLPLRGFDVLSASQSTER